MKAYDRDGGVLRRMNLKNSLYYNGFMEGYLYRTGCYTCPYATEKRVADLTLGDFWGIGEETPYPNAAAELKKAGGRVLFARAESYPCASSDIRSGKIPREQWPEVLPPEVLAVIKEHRLYGSV